MVLKTQQRAIGETNLNSLAIVLAMIGFGFWHAWAWYFERVKVSMEEAFGLMLLMTYLCFAALKVLSTRKNCFSISLWPIALLFILYSLSFLGPVPSIVRAALAFLALSFAIFQATFGHKPPFSLWALVLLSLPVLPSLQFYLGYPARYLSASVTVPLLRLNGIPVTQEGTNLRWNDQLIQFDAPCSGVTMLWAGLFFTLFVCLVYRFSFLKTTIALSIATICIFIGNVIRASNLFYLEIGAIAFARPWFHEAIGMASFILVAALIFFALSRIKFWRAYE